MTPAPRFPRRVLATVLMALLAGCATTAPRTALQERVGRSDLDVGALRIRVRDLARRLPAMLEVLAEDIAANTDSEPVRRGMLEFKANSVPTLQSALLLPDPVAALVDAWALVAQLQDALPHSAVGASPEVLTRAQDGLRQVEAELEAQWKELAGQDDLSETRARVHQWAAEHPLQGRAYARHSTVPLMASLTNSARIRPLGAAASLLEDTRDLTARVDLYAGSLPRQARWQAQLAAVEMASAALEAPALRAAVDEL
ncbi:chemotaxis protein, partial [Pyxidicoccus sp. 3LFB2]